MSRMLEASNHIAVAKAVRDWFETHELQKETFWADKDGRPHHHPDSDRIARACLRGARFLVLEDDTLGSDTKNENDFARFLGFQGGANAIASWNNAPNRTKEDVIARLDEAIERAAAAEKIIAFYETHDHTKYALWADERGPFLDRDPSTSVVIPPSPENVTRACLLGAFCIVEGVSIGGSRYIDESLDFAQTLGFNCVDQLVDWNNEDDRTKEEVVERLHASLLTREAA